VWRLTFWCFLHFWRGGAFVLAPARVGGVSGTPRGTRAGHSLQSITSLLTHGLQTRIITSNPLARGLENFGPGKAEAISTTGKEKNGLRDERK
jgi:hypothetical protein